MVEQVLGLVKELRAVQAKPLTGWTRGESISLGFGSCCFSRDLGHLRVQDTTRQDPEYNWRDLIRSDRSSNEERLRQSTARAWENQGRQRLRQENAFNLGF